MRHVFPRRRPSLPELTLPQLHVLITLAHCDNCKMSELSRALGVTLGNMTGMADRLLKSGYLSRRPDDKDRRIIRLQLTTKGKKAISIMKEHQHRTMRQVMAKMTVNDQETMLRILQNLLANMKRQQD